MSGLYFGAGEMAAAVSTARTRAYEARVQARISRLLRLAEVQSGTTGMTTHEAKDHFRTRGARTSAHRLHVLLGLLATRGRRQAGGLRAATWN